MKRILIGLLFLVPFAPAFGVEIYGSAKNLIVTKTIDNATNVYVKNYAGELIMIYKANFLYTKHDPISVEQYNDIIFIVFSCDNQDKVCDRFFNCKNNQLSEVYDNFISANMDVEKPIVALYDEVTSQVILKTLFSTCRKPTTYPLKIKPNTIFGRNTDFLLNGNLLIEYSMSETGKHMSKVFKIDYQKIYKDCGSS